MSTFIGQPYLVYCHTNIVLKTTVSEIWREEEIKKERDREREREKERASEIEREREREEREERETLYTNVRRLLT